MNIHVCTHRQFDPAAATLDPVSQNDYQAARSHPAYPPKDRSRSLMPRVRFANVTDQLAQHRSTRAFLLNAADRVKVVGFRGGAKPVSTGTSQVGRLCVTDGMACCIAVAIGGEKINARSGEREPGAKARIFHVYPYNDAFPTEISNYVSKLAAEGLRPKAALHGGGDAYGEKLPNELRALFKALNVPLEFDEAGIERGNKDTLLGAVVGRDNRVQFVTELLAVRSSRSLQAQGRNVQEGQSLQSLR